VGSGRVAGRRDDGICARLHHARWSSYARALFTLASLVSLPHWRGQQIVTTIKMPIWDDRKRLRNLRLHGLDFVGAEAIWDDLTITREDIRRHYGERRWVTLGVLRGAVVVLVHTERGDDDRYISLRRADTYEAISYLEAASWRLP
jgi:uncharacterized protein